MKHFDHKQIEQKWQKKWEEAKIYEPDIEKAQKPFFNLMMFPYPSAEGLHVGNMYAFTGADVYGRFKRMQGNDVFEPIGLDGFGIHSENYALKVGNHPKDQAKKSQENFYRQLHAIGNGFAWSNKLETYDPEYYKWTQWIFVQMYKNGLAYRKSAKVNWCPSCKTVLADEQVEAGVCERCKSEVVRKDMEQWFFKITHYADRLLANIENIDWPQKIKVAQRQWIGKKEGINITYVVKGTDTSVVCFTTRPDTNFGATFVVVAPEYAQEHLLAYIPSQQVEDVKKYIDQALHKTEQQRLKEEKLKTGVFTGLYAINNLNNKELPIWIGDFVLKDVGTGAVVGVPGHDTRDFEFAKAMKIPVIRVVVASDGDTSPITALEQVQESEGTMINSSFLDGMNIHDATKKIMDYLEEKGWGKRVYNYHLRDWLISRQRYWGPPIPMIHCDTCGWKPVPEDQLPVLLPDLSDWKPTGDGKGPLEKAPKDWLSTTCPKCKGTAKRETDVSDTFLDSSWYHFRYPSVRADSKSEKPFDSEITKKWLPVHAYIGGAEHAVLHLLYARFVCMALRDWGYVDFDEPYPFLFSHGLIIKDGAKMSKSRGNVVNPDEYIKKFGADTLRTYLMFLGPYNQGGDFRDSGIAGTRRFLDRVYAMYQDEKVIAAKTTEATAKKLHQTIAQMTDDMAVFKYNTAIARLMELINTWRQEGEAMSREDSLTVIKLFAPFAPHMAEELYQSGIMAQTTPASHFSSIHKEQWPSFDASKMKDEMITVVVQVNSKVRGAVSVDKQARGNKDQIILMGKQNENVRKYLEGKTIKKEIFVPGKLVNFVV